MTSKNKFEKEVEKIGKSIGEKVGIIVGKVVGEMIGLVIAFVIILFVMPKLSFVTEDFSRYLPIAIWTTLLSTALKIWKHLTPKPISHFFEALSLLPSIYGLVMIIVIFPFDFAVIGQPVINDILRLVFYVGIFGSAIGFFVNIVRGFGVKMR